MNKIRVANIQRLCVSDGPGVRTVVFLNGCTLQCPWCCNPETIHTSSTLFFDKGKCLYPKVGIMCKDCEKTGAKNSIFECPLNAYEKSYNDYTEDELFDSIIRDKNIFKAGGGVTFSGGEPLLQINEIEPLLKRLKQSGVNIAFESTLYVKKDNMKLAVKYADYWLIDLKFQFGYIKNPDYNIPLNSQYENLSLIQSLSFTDNIKYRMVMMREALPNLNKIIDGLLRYNVSEIELLEYHNLAESKYLQLGKSNRVFNRLTEEDILYVEKEFHKYNIKTNYLQL